jgi:hypothetical protein
MSSTEPSRAYCTEHDLKLVDSMDVLLEAEG